MVQQRSFTVDKAVTQGNDLSFMLAPLIKARGYQFVAVLNEESLGQKVHDPMELSTALRAKYGEGRQLAKQGVAGLLVIDVNAIIGQYVLVGDRFWLFSQRNLCCIELTQHCSYSPLELGLHETESFPFPHG